MFRGDAMKKLQSIVLNACAYTVLISVVILSITTLISENGNLGISFTRYLTFILCGIAIALANLIFSLNSIHIIIRMALHYGALLVAFLVIFTTDGILPLNDAADYFVAIIIYSLMYVLLFATVYGIKRAVNKLNGGSKNGKANTKKEKTKYEAKFK